jgi:hypothetical protein
VTDASNFLAKSRNLYLRQKHGFMLYTATQQDSFDEGGGGGGGGGNGDDK